MVFAPNGVDTAFGSLFLWNDRTSLQMVWAVVAGYHLYRYYTSPPGDFQFVVSKKQIKCLFAYRNFLFSVYGFRET